MISLDAFSDEFQKIAASRRDALYSPGIAAHEAGHALTHKTPGVTAARALLPILAAGYAGGRLGHQVTGGPGMGAKEFGAVSAVGNLPVLADEAGASVLGLKALKKDKKMTKEDWKRTALQLAAVNSSYLSSPLMDVATMAAAKGGAHPLVQLGMQLATKPALGKAWAALGMMKKGPKVTAQRAKEIVQSTAPGTPVFATRTPIPGGSMYVPPSGKSKIMKTMISSQLGGFVSKKDLGTLHRKGGVLLAPLDPKAQAKRILNPLEAMPDKTKFRRIT